MSKRTHTSVSALAGRVIESVTVWHSGGNENPVSLEIRCVGGTCFFFSITSEVVAKGVATLARSDHQGDLINRKVRTFTAKGTMPYAPDDEEGDD